MNRLGANHKDTLTQRRHILFFSPLSIKSFFMRNGAPSAHDASLEKPLLVPWSSQRFQAKLCTKPFNTVVAGLSIELVIGVIPPG